KQGEECERGSRRGEDVDQKTSMNAAAVPFPLRGAVAVGGGGWITSFVQQPFPSPIIRYKTEKALCADGCSIAPVQLADLRRAPPEMPVAAEGAHARLVGAAHRDVGRHPVLAVADHHRLTLVLPGDRRDRAVDDLLDGEDAGRALDPVLDRRLLHAEEM